MPDTKWRPKLSAADGSVYRALAERICAAAADGALAPGARLPAVRDLAHDLGISPGAVARAYRLATERGVLEATVGRGTFVRGPEARPATAFAALIEGGGGGVIDLRGNRAVDVGQDADLTAALSRLIADAGGPLPLTGYRTAEDDREAHAAVADWIAAGGVPAAPGRVTITPGAQTAALLALSAARRGREPFACAEPAVHPGLRDAAATTGVALEPVATDAEGVLPDALDAACRRRRPAAALLSSTLQNPTLATMSTARRDAIVAVARSHDILLIEDDVYGRLTPSPPPPLAALAPERTFYVSSLSKCVAAGLRAGFVLAPESHARSVLRLHQAVLHHTPYLVTALAAGLIRSGEAERLRRRVAAEVTRRAAIAARLLGPLGARTHPAASFAFLPTPPPWTSAEFAAAAAAEGVMVAPRDVYALRRGHEPDFVRIALGANASAAEIEDGLGRLARLLEGGPGAAVT